MFGWLPIIGPIIDGIVSIFNKYKDTELGKYTIDGKVDVAAMQASAQIIADTKDDIGTRLARDILLFPWAVYGGLSGWDYTVANHWPSLVFNTAVVPVQSGLSYLPYMVFAYLLGTAGFSIWKRGK